MIFPNYTDCGGKSAGMEIGKKSPATGEPDAGM
jgi:hypothetical protein